MAADQVFLNQLFSVLESGTFYPIETGTFDGLLHNSQTTASAISLAELKNALSGESNPEASKEWLVPINVKLIKKPSGYDGPLQFSIDVDLNSKRALFVKECIYQKIRLPIKSQRLISQGKALGDDKLLKDYYDPESSGWTIQCMPTPGASIEADTSNSEGNRNQKELSEEFWAGLEEYLKSHLTPDKVPKILLSFRNAYEKLNKSS